MELSTAIALIKGGVQIDDTRAQIWADLGAGSGLFTRALATLLPPASKIYAVDRDSAALNSIDWEHTDKSLERVDADINRALALPHMDGALLANVLHYLPDQLAFLQRLKGNLCSNGVFIIIEYDTATGNRWVPYPISFNRMRELAAGLRLEIQLLGTAPSKFNAGTLYSALLQPPKN